MYGIAVFGVRRRLAALSLVLGLCLSAALTAAGVCSAVRCARVCAEVRQDTLRLHIRADSDTIRDQTVKLRVRDAVLRLLGQLYDGASNRAQAERITAENLPRIEAAAQKVLAAWGCRTAVRARLTDDSFARMRYGAVTLPAGTYRALRVELGSARGHNWWCCLYPQFCLAASGAHYEKPEENALTAGRYEVRFAAADWWKKRRAAAAAKK